MGSGIPVFTYVDFFAVRNKERLDCAGRQFNTVALAFNTIDNTRQIRDKLKQIF